MSLACSDLPRPARPSGRVFFSCLHERNSCVGRGEGEAREINHVGLSAILILLYRQLLPEARCYFCPLMLLPHDRYIGPLTLTQVLAFYSHMGSENLRSFNTHDADLRLRDLIADIKLLLTGAVVLSPGSNNSPPPVVRSFV